MQLFTYYRSSAAYRVRIALNLKGQRYESIPVHLVKDGGQQRHSSYLTKNPQGLVPTLLDGKQGFTQSLAIIEYLEEVFPSPALLPTTPAARAYVRSLAQAIACDIHPLNNLRVLQYLSTELAIDDQAKKDWYQHWVRLGFDAVEAMLGNSAYTDKFCYGEQAGLADCCLIPQVYNALRFDVDMSNYPVISRINQACLQLDAFKQAAPEAQGDAE